MDFNSRIECTYSFRTAGETPMDEAVLWQAAITALMAPIYLAANSTGTTPVIPLVAAKSTMSVRP